MGSRFGPAGLISPSAASMRLRPVVSNEPVAHSAIARWNVQNADILSGVCGKGVDGSALSLRINAVGLLLPKLHGTHNTTGLDRCRAGRHRAGRTALRAGQASAVRLPSADHSENVVIIAVSRGPPSASGRNRPTIRFFDRLPRRSSLARRRPAPVQNTVAAPVKMGEYMEGARFIYKHSDILHGWRGRPLAPIEGRGSASGRCAPRLTVGPWST
jgi:hypothetical protein